MNDFYKLKAQVFWLNPAWQGAFWKISSCACFAGINAVVRYLGVGSPLGIEAAMPVNVMIFFQNVFGFCFMLPYFLGFAARFKLKKPNFAAGGLRNWKNKTAQLHFFRVLSAVLGILFMYSALQKMSIAESVALSFTGPAFTILGARLLLSETLGKQRLLAVGLSLLGAFIITRPDLILLKPKVSLGFSALLPLLSAIALALSKLLTRQLAKEGETAESLTLFLLLGMIPVSFILACFEWVTPSYFHWPWLVLLGLLAVFAHITFGKAYALAEVTFLMPFGFSKFLFSMLLGYYCFLEIPSLSLWLGMTVIAVSLVCMAYKMPLYSIANRFKSN